MLAKQVPCGDSQKKTSFDSQDISTGGPLERCQGSIHWKVRRLFLVAIPMFHAFPCAQWRRPSIPLVAIGREHSSCEVEANLECGKSYQDPYRILAWRS